MKRLIAFIALIVAVTNPVFLWYAFAGLVTLAVCLVVVSPFLLFVWDAWDEWFARNPKRGGRRGRGWNPERTAAFYESDWLWCGRGRTARGGYTSDGSGGGAG